MDCDFCGAAMVETGEGTWACRMPDCGHGAIEKMEIPGTQSTLVRRRTLKDDDTEFIDAAGNRYEKQDGTGEWRLDESVPYRHTPSTDAVPDFMPAVRPKKKPHELN